MYYLVALLCIARGMLAGIGLAVSIVFVLANLPSADPTGGGAYVFLLLVSAPILALVGAVGEVIALTLKE